MLAERHAVARRLVQLELGVHGPQGLHALVARHQGRDLDLAGGDHLDIDPVVGQRAEHAVGDAGLRGHAQADDRDLGHVGVVRDALAAELVGRLLTAASAIGRSSSSTVNEMSARPSAPTFCTIMSTATFIAASSREDAVGSCPAGRARR